MERGKMGPKRRKEIEKLKRGTLAKPQIFKIKCQAKKKVSLYPGPWRVFD